MNNRKCIVCGSSVHVVKLIPKTTLKTTKFKWYVQCRCNSTSCGVTQ